MEGRRHKLQLLSCVMCGLEEERGGKITLFFMGEGEILRQIYFSFPHY